MNATEKVTAFLNALTAEDFAAAKTHVTPDLSFTGVLGSRSGANAYFTDMEKMKLKYNIRKMIAEGDEVAVQYDINMGGKTIYSIGWYTLRDGQVHNIRVVFDPRPVLE